FRSVAHQLVVEVDEVDVALVTQVLHLLRDDDRAAQDHGRGPLNAVVQPDRATAGTDRERHGGQLREGVRGDDPDGRTEGLREHPGVHLDDVLPDDRARSLAALLRDRDTGSVRDGVDAERLTGAATGEEGYVREVGQ